MLSGLSEADDAAVLKLDDDRALIFTTDFFTPIVDDPFQFGEIAAANAMSDVYAMGGEVVLALNIACFPEDMDDETVRKILNGGASKVREAGGIIAGGHTVDDKEPKYGLAVMGMVHPKRIFEKSGARPGDRLFLSKHLGTGIVTTALKADLVAPERLKAAVDSMRRLNRGFSKILQRTGCRTATDITGFSLMGHGLEIADHSCVRLVMDVGKLPFLPGATEYGEMWLFPAGANKNERAYKSCVTVDAGIPEEIRMLTFVPETSGGLLAAVPEERVGDFLGFCENEGVFVREIGYVEPGTGIHLRKDR